MTDRHRKPKPLPVEVVPHAEPLDFVAWADRYAAIVIRLHLADQQQREAA